MTLHANEPALKVVRPSPGENLTIEKGSTFVIGTVKPPRAKVTVNGVAADVSDDGAFIAFAPIRPLPKPQPLHPGAARRKEVNAVLELVAEAGEDRVRQRILVTTPASRKGREPATKALEEPLTYRVGEEQILSRATGADWGLLYLPQGASVLVDARKGHEVRLKLASTEETWVNEKILQRNDQRPVLDARRVPGLGSSEARFEFTSLVPCSVRQIPSPSRLKVTFHSPDSIREFEVPIPGRPWGFAVDFEKSTAALSFRTPRAGATGLRHKVICLDPGHNPDPGAIGPRGLEEREVNLKIALALEKLLRGQGAQVVFTHRAEPLPLGPRRAAALQYRPDILVSLHNNSVPDGTDPRTNNGTSTFYYHPQSKPLADALQAAMLKELGLPDLKVNRKSLYVCRMSEFPSVLVEPTFIILPEHEKLLMNQAGQEKIASAIFEGIRSFFER